MHFVNWAWMGAMMIVLLLLIGGIGYAAVVVSWWDADRDGQPRGA